MVREDILGGLRLALSRGDSLQNAMQSFYNAGYRKEEIEEAARALHKQVVQQPPQQTIQQSRQIPQQSQQAVSQIPRQQTPPQKQAPIPVTSPPIQTPVQNIQRVPMQRPAFSYQNPEENMIPKEEKESIINRFKQLRTVPQAEHREKVSSYGEYKRPGLDAVTIILIIILIALLGVLAAVFFFKEDLIAFLNKFLD